MSARRILMAVAVATGTGALLEAGGLPAGWLMGGLLGGAACALGWGEPVELPTITTRASEAAIGAMLGALLEPSALEPLADAWPAVAAVVAGTLALSVGAGVLLRRRTGLDRATASLGMLAGAAPGTVAASRELGADARLVALMQFARVALIALSVPPLALALGHGATGPDAGLASVTGHGPGPAALALACAAIGGVLATRLRLPAGALLGPLVLAAGATVSGVEVGLPEPLLVAALVIFGLGIGLRFDRVTLRRARSVASAAVAGILGVVAGCALLAVVLALAADLDALTAYLATTPGGFSTVLATASDTGAQTTVVLGVQTLRLLLMVMFAPALGVLERDVG